MTKNYEVQKMTGDATRPYAVIRTFRSFNKVVQRYEDKAAADRRARDMNRKLEQIQLPEGKRNSCQL